MSCSASGTVLHALSDAVIKPSIRIAVRTRPPVRTGFVRNGMTILRKLARPSIVAQTKGRLSVIGKYRKILFAVTSLTFGVANYPENAARVAHGLPWQKRIG